jgi:hypothetical protein
MKPHAKAPVAERDLFSVFAKDLVVQWQETKRAPLALFLGQGCVPVLRELLVDEILERTGARPPKPTAAAREKAYREEWSTTPLEGRHAYFWKTYRVAKTTRSAEMQRSASGYEHLAQLVKAGLFDRIVTTGMDTELEHYLARTLDFHEWRVFDVGLDPTEAITDAMLDQSGGRRQVAIARLRGNAAKKFYPVGDDHLAAFRDVAREVLAIPLVAVGYDDAADADVRQYLAEGADLYFAAPEAPAEGSAIEEALARRRAYVITGEVGVFEEFFRRLRMTLVGDPEVPSGIKQLVDSGVPLGRVPNEKLVELIDEPERPGDDLVEIVRETRQEKSDGGDEIVSIVKRVRITIGFDDRGRRLSFRADGDLQKIGNDDHPVELDAEGYNRLLHRMSEDLHRAYRTGDAQLHAVWREQQIWEGRRLYDSIFKRVPDLMNLYGTARGTTLGGGELMFSFEGQRHLLGMPYELLHDDQTGPWATRYAISRQVRGVEVRGGSFEALLGQLRRRGEPLSVLLLGAEGVPRLGVEQRLQRLGEVFEGAAEGRIGLRLDSVVVDGQSDAADRVARRVAQGGYHVLCYEGHGSNDGEHTGLMVGRPPALVSERALHTALRQALPALVFYNSCVGARTGGEHLLRNHDFLGTMDATVMAGVPYVLGYRWYVTNQGAERFADHFVRALFESSSPAMAVLHARRTIWQETPNDETWTSPILVAQPND